MKNYRYLAVLCCLLVVPLLLTNFVAGSDTKKKIKGDVCSASNPSSICAAANTCGSASSPCSIDIKHSQGSYATATPSIPDAKSSKAFCIKVGTTVTFMSSSKNTGFVIDFGSSDPFDHEGAIMGGADRPITVTAKHPGCYTYSVGACTEEPFTACAARVIPNSSSPPTNSRHIRRAISFARDTPGERVGFRSLVHREE
jgi:plastocyanin